MRYIGYIRIITHEGGVRMHRTDREITDFEQLKTIIENGEIINTAIMDSPAPYVVPTNYAYEFDGRRLTLYLHGAARGKKWALIANDPNVSFSIVSDAHLEPDEHTMYYESILGTGNAILMTDQESKEHALRLLLKKELGHFDGPLDPDDLAHVGIIKINVATYTGKQHNAAH